MLGALGYTAYEAARSDDPGDIWKTGGLGVAQGGVNTLNGLQDFGIGLANLPAFAWNYTGGWVLPNTPYIYSPDWSRGMFVEESDAVHGWSKFLGGEGAGTLLTLGAGQLAKLRWAAGQTGPLSTFSKVARTVLERPLARLGQAELPFRVSNTLKVRLGRFFATATKTYPSLKDTRIGRLLRSLPLVRRLQWEQGHVFFQQRWWKHRGPTQWYSGNRYANKGLRSLGNAGFNLMPMPRAMNRWLGRHPWASFGVGAGTGLVTIGGLEAAAYHTYRLGAETLGLVSDAWNAWED